MADAETSMGWNPPRAGERWTEAVGRAMVESLRRSRESRAAFARRHGLNSQRIKYWLDRLEGSARRGRRRERQADTAAAFAPVRVVEARADAAAAALALEVVVCGVVVRVPACFEEQHLRRVVEALRGASC